MDNRQNKERRFWDKFAKIYDPFINVIFSDTYKAIFDNLDSDLSTTHNVLDIGTGTGLIPFYICTKVSNVTATDISPEMIHIANQKKKKLNIQNIDFQIQDSYNLTFPDKSFDIVIASNLLHILYNPDKPLNEIKRILKDNGTFIAPTLCVGENTISKIIATVTGTVSGFKFVNKWSIKEFKTMLVSKEFSIEKTVIIKGRFPLAYIAMKTGIDTKPLCKQGN
jgi:phosphatidylethanolamine/phosphatidyl-N-methylethanolamine N-methyltransferase